MRRGILFFFPPPPSIRKKKGNQRSFCSEMKCQVAPPPTPPCEVGVGGDAGRVGGRRGRIGPTLMRHAYLICLRDTANKTQTKFFFLIFFQGKKKHVRAFIFHAVNGRTDGRTGKRKNKNSSGRNQIVTQTDSWPDTAGQISSAASNLGINFSFSNMNNNN